MTRSRQHARAALYHRTLAILERQSAELEQAIGASGLVDSDAASVMRLAVCQYVADRGGSAIGAKLIEQAPNEPKGNRQTRPSLTATKRNCQPKRGA